MSTISRFILAAIVGLLLINACAPNMARRTVPVRIGPTGCQPDGVELESSLPIIVRIINTSQAVQRVRLQYGSSDRIEWQASILPGFTIIIDWRPSTSGTYQLTCSPEAVAP